MQNSLILNVLPLVSDDFAFGSRGDMTVYENYNVIPFKSCVQKFTVSNCLQIYDFYIYNSIKSVATHSLLGIF